MKDFLEVEIRMESKKRFKMYKSGKLWVSAAIVSLSVMAGVALNGQNVHADDKGAAVKTEQPAKPAEGDQSNQNNTSSEKPAAPDQGGDKGNTAGDQDKGTTEDKTFSREINFKNDSVDDKSEVSKSITQNVTVPVTTKDGKTTVNVEGKTWNKVTVPVKKGYDAKLNGKVITELPTKVELKDGIVDSAPLQIVYVLKEQQPVDKPTDDDLKDPKMYKKVTRTITIDGQKKAVQTVYFGKTRKQNDDGTYTYSKDWKVLGNGSWDKYDIPTQDDKVSKYKAADGKEHYVTEISAQDVTAETKDVEINIVYVSAKNVVKADPNKKAEQKDLWKSVTRTINFQFPSTDITKNPVVQTVEFKRNKITTLDKEGKENTTYTDWEAIGNPVWPKYIISEKGYNSKIDDVRVNQVDQKIVDGKTQNKTITVTYISVLTDTVNKDVVPGLKGNWASIDKIYMTDTGIHVTGWNANSESLKRNNHFLIILDYGPNPVTGQFREVGRKLVSHGVDRPDVVKVHPVWNAAISGFDDTIDLDTANIKAGDKLRILSRWSSDDKGNIDYVDLASSYYTMDYGTNVGHWDGANIVNDGKQLEVSGWHATNQSVGRPHHFVILYDATTNREIGRQEIKEVERTDVSEAFPNLLNASKSGFDVKFDLTNVDLGHNIQIISRYSDATNGEGSHVDYWFPAKRFVSGNTSNLGFLDGVSSKDNAVMFTGWNATNVSQAEPNHFMILFDTTANKQVASLKIDDKNGVVGRPDVKRKHSGIANAENSGFQFTVGMDKLTFGHTYALVSRYSSNGDGNGNYGAHSDYWFNNAFTFNQQAYFIDNASFVAEPAKAVQAAEEKEQPKADTNKNDETTNNSGEGNKANDPVNKPGDTSTDNDNKGNNPATKPNDTSNDKDNTNDSKPGQPVTNPSKDEGNKDDKPATTINKKKLHVTGWMVSDGSVNYKTPFVIVLDGNNKELGRAQVTLTHRDDVQNATPTIANSGKSAFDTVITLSDENSALTNGLKFVLRYTNDKDGNGPSADQWTPVFHYNKDTNKFA